MNPEDQQLHHEPEEYQLGLSVSAPDDIPLEKVAYVLDPKEYAEPIKEPVFWIEVEKIKPNPYQPRKHFDETSLSELAESIKEYGILQPLVVSKIIHDVENGTRIEYQLIAGERRLMASKRVGMTHVPAVIRQNQEEREKLEMAIIENLQRFELSPMEMARAFAKLSDEFGLPQREIANRIGKSRESVSNTIRLLQLPFEAQKALDDKKISESHARLILTISNPEKQRGLLAEILTKNLSVRETELIVNRLKPASFLRPKIEHVDPALLNLESSLEAILGKPVSLERKGKKGKLSITFYSDEDLKDLIERIVGQSLLQGHAPLPEKMSDGMEGEVQIEPPIINES